MKKVLYLLLILQNAAVASNITTEAQLRTNWAAGGSHTIAGGTYNLGGNLSNNGFDLALVPTGNVIIDGGGIRTITARDGTFNIGDASGQYTITFQNTYQNVLDFIAQTKVTIVNLYYVTVRDGSAGFNLVHTRAGYGYPLTLNADHCLVYRTVRDTTSDGFNMDNGGGSYLDAHTHNLINCVIYNCGNNAVTAHGTNQTIYATGCIFHDCETPVGTDGDSKVYLISCTIYNGLGSHLVSLSSNASLFVDSCYFYNPTATKYHINHGSTGRLLIKNSVFNGQGSNPNGAVYTKSNRALIENCVFSNIVSNNYPTAIVFSGEEGVVDYCTFYNCYDGLRARKRTQVTNCIFSKITGSALKDDDKSYFYNQPTCGNNVFHDCNVAIAAFAGSGIKATDITDDPLFLDPAAGDFRLQPESPCFRTGSQVPGNSMLNKGRTTRGAWQALSDNIADLNGDGMVNFVDFSIFAEQWLWTIE